MKEKINISKKMFYFFLLCLSLLSFLTTISLLDFLIFGTNEFDHLTEQQLKEKINFFITSKIISYISNILTIILFLIYLLFSRHKIKNGYIFVLSWSIMMIAMACAPYFQNVQHFSSIRYFLSISTTAIYFLILCGLLYLGNLIRIKRSIKKYEEINIHIKKK